MLRGRTRWLVAVALALVLPFPVPVHPQISFVVRDRDALAVGAEVELTTQHYTLEHRSVNTVRHTDLHGAATFPSRHVWSCAACFAAGALLNFLQAGVHASFGPSVWATARVTGCEPATALPHAAEAVTEIVVCKRSADAPALATPPR